MTYVNIGVCSVGGVRSKKELAARGIDTMQDANRCLAEHYRAAFSEGFTVPATEPGTAFVPFIGPGLANLPGQPHINLLIYQYVREVTIIQSNSTTTTPNRKWGSIWRTDADQRCFIENDRLNHTNLLKSVYF